MRHALGMVATRKAPHAGMIGEKLGLAVLANDPDGIFNSDLARRLELSKPTMGGAA